MICSDCNQDKEEKAFATFKTRKGETRRRGICWACRGKYAKDNFDRLQQWRKDYNESNRDKKRGRDAERKREIAEYVDRIKNVPCADCRVSWPPVAMDFDHVTGDKYMSVASMRSGAYRLELIIEEIKKCEVVCACCHRLRTRNRRDNLAPTGAMRTRRTGGRTQRKVKLSALDD